MIRTRVRPSTIAEAGLGLFADEFIKKGTVTWRYCPGFDLIMPKDDLLRLSEAARTQFLNYCYFDKNTKRFILCGDDERFINHSSGPNIGQSKHDDEINGVEIALRDIQPGEELFCDYYEFDMDADRKLKKQDMYSYLNYVEQRQKRYSVNIFQKIISMVSGIFS